MNRHYNNAELKDVLLTVNKMARKRGKVGIVDHEDIAQETMIKYLNKRGGPFAPTMWLYKTVKTTVWDACRKKYQQKELFEEFGNEEELYNAIKIAESSRAVCETAMESRVDCQFLEMKLREQLDAAPFRLLEMHADGFSYEEIAEKMKIKLGTVRSRIHYARKKARALLEV